MSLGSTQPFRVSGTSTIAATATAAAAKLTGSGEAVLITNGSGAMAFVRFGVDLSVTATVSDTPVPAGGRLFMHVGTFAATVSVVLSSGAGSVYVTRGDGTVY